ncbi:MAG: PAS domain-containing sensor histidine kinase [Gemmatirosa sp.]
MRRWRLGLVIAGALVIAGLAAWRAAALRQALFSRVEQRLGNTASVTAGSVTLWLRERAADARTAAELAGRASADPHAAWALQSLHGQPGYSHLRVLDRSGTTIGGVADVPLAAEERHAFAAARRTGGWQVAGPFDAPTASGLAVAIVHPVADGGRAAAIVMRFDPALALLAIAAGRASRTGTEEGRLVARVGDSVLMVRPTRDGYLTGRAALASAPAMVRRALAGVDTGGRHDTQQGREVLAGVRHVSGAPWAVVRQVDVRGEMDAVTARELRGEIVLLLSALAAVALGALTAARIARVQQAEARERERSLLRAALEATADGILVVNLDGEVQAYNRRFLELWRIPDGATQVHTRTRLPAVAAQLCDPERYVADVLAINAQPAIESHDVLHFRDGRRVERLSQPQRIGDRIVGRVWSFRDITAREEAAAALRASEASARAFVERSPYGICRVSTDGRFLEVNPALVGLLGYPTAEALLATSVRAVYVDPTERAQVLQRHLAGVDTIDAYEVRWRRFDGAVASMRVSSRVVRDETGGVVCYEAFLEDVAPLREAERALRQAEKLAAVGQFVSGVAHELNNPLAAVLLFSEELLEEDAMAGERETLSLIRDQALRARTIVRDLLAFVRGRDGVRDRLPAREVLERVAHSLDRQLAAGAAGHDARLSLALDDDLGVVHVDRSAIEQVVVNLVMNAAQAAPGGTVRLSAGRLPASSTRPASLRIVVEDDGPGIAPDVLPRLFEPFFTTKPVGVGTGLGLSVSLGVAERHGGTLEAENRAPFGSGARLTLTLPLVAAPALVNGGRHTEAAA